MDKDIRLYLPGSGAQGTPATIGAVTAGIWEALRGAEPDVALHLSVCRGSMGARRGPR